jgi:hypothetical protein
MEQLPYVSMLYTHQHEGTAIPKVSTGSFLRLYKKHCKKRDNNNETARTIHPAGVLHSLKNNGTRVDKRADPSLPP